MKRTKENFAGITNGIVNMRSPKSIEFFRSIESEAFFRSEELLLKNVYRTELKSETRVFSFVGFYESFFEFFREFFYLTSIFLYDIFSFIRVKNYNNFSFSRFCHAGIFSGMSGKTSSAGENRREIKAIKRIIPEFLNRSYFESPGKLFYLKGMWC
jgi:hypothetical protein